MTKDEIVHYLKVKIASIINKDVDKIDEEMNFLRIGISSIETLKVINRIRRELNVEINPVAMFEYKTIDEFADYLSGQVNKSEVT